MRTSSSTVFSVLVTAALAVGTATAFVPTSAATSHSRSSLNAGNDDDGELMQRAAAVDDDETAKESGEGSSPMIAMMERFRMPNPLSELADIFSNFDDVVDDFFNKRVSDILFVRYILKVNCA